VAENPSPRLVEHEVPQGFIGGDPARLFPDRIAWRRRDAANDHIADLAFGMARNHMYDFGRAHFLSLSPFGRRDCGRFGELEEAARLG
jgi:hypothetical protein